MVEVRPNVAVTCRSCGKDIPFVRPERPAPEISLRCPACDRRLIYAATDVRALVAPSVKRRGSSHSSR
jgi:DNA-directed RNA polymerase subunit RPC12/RpoP